MRLDRDALIVRWAYLFEKRSRWGWQTSLCALFWRAVLLTPLKLLLPLTAVAFLGWAVYANLVETLKVVGIMAFIFITTAAIVGAIEVLKSDTVRESVVWQGAKAVKGKFCPIVQIEEARKSEAA
jgi:amino acid permease